MSRGHQEDEPNNDVGPSSIHHWLAQPVMIHMRYPTIPLAL
jgi:hypothetical protein